MTDCKVAYQPGRRLFIFSTVAYNGTIYFYATNLQGDVVAILDSTGKAVVKYSYDAWGKLLSTTGSLASTLGVHNPLRYRGYVYDPETGLYYLQSRYYDPAMGRFINADAYVSTGQGFVGNNMLAYCNNNPINAYDPHGTWTFTLSLFIDGTFFFFGVSGSIGIVVDDKWNVAIQASYSAPTYMDSDLYHVGLADIGIGGSAQFTDDDTLFDLEGPACYAGVSGGAGPSFGVDMVYSGVEISNDEQSDEMPNGVSASVGYGIGIDAHFKQSRTHTIWQINIVELIN